MWMSVDTLLKCELDVDRVTITEFYPKTSNKNVPKGIIIPVDEQGITNPVFGSVVPALKDDIHFQSGPNKDDLMSFEEYDDMMKEVISIISENNPKISVSLLGGIEKVYDNYAKRFDDMFIAGLVSVVGTAISNPIDILSYIPPESPTEWMLGYNTYTTSVLRMFPDLCLDVRTADHMYKDYVSQFEPYTPSTEILTLLKIGSIDKLTDMVDGASKGISRDTILRIWRREIPDFDLDEYYAIMLGKYGIREKVALGLLMYRSDIVKDTIQSASDVTGISIDRPTVYREPKVVTRSTQKSYSLF